MRVSFIVVRSLTGASLIGCSNSNIAPKEKDTEAPEDDVSQVWVSDNGDGTYTNPVLYAEFNWFRVIKQ